MATKFGTAAFLLALVAILLPYYGIMVGWAALVLACVAALMGDKVLVLATFAVSVIDYVFLKPDLWLSALSPNDNNLIEISIILTAAPIVALMLRKLIRWGR